jgi:LysM repeat protein
MTAKRIFQLIVVAAILATSLAPAGGALASGNCASYVTVQWGDTLSGIASYCGTTAEAIQAANPGLGWWVYAGQVLYIPTGYPSSYGSPSAGGTYTIQWGDTLGNIAASRGVSLSDLLAVNPQIWNVNLIYPGQVITLPAGSSGYVTGGYPITDPQPAYKHLKVVYGYGLIVRDGPGKNYAEIRSRYVSAVYGTEWTYRTSSLTIDSMGFVWVEITLDPMAPRSVGWILVRDTTGRHYTEPPIDP